MRNKGAAVAVGNRRARLCAWSHRRRGRRLVSSQTATTIPRTATMPRSATLQLLRPGRSPLLAIAGVTASLTLACATCGPVESTTTTATDPTPAAVSPRVVVDIFAFARVLGTIAPCGCTTEPLGGLQYAFGYIEANSTPAARLVLEPGSFLFPDPNGPEAAKDEAAWAQAEQRASALQQRFSAVGAQLVSGLGPTDVSSPKTDSALTTWPLPRVLANSRALDGKGVQAHRMVALKAGDATIDAGVTAAVEPALAPAGWAAEPLAPALQREVAAMRKAGAELAVVMLQGSRATAEQLAKDVPGIDLIVVGVPVGQERTRVGAPPARINGAWIVEPGDRAQTMTHVRLQIDPKVAAALPHGEAWTQVPTAAAQLKELARLDARLAKFREDPTADQAFIKRLEQERVVLAASIEKPALPADPVIVTLEQAKVTCHLAADPEASKALHGYDEWVSTQNQRRFAGVKPPAPAKGQAGYVGGEECAACHAEEAEQWATTRHAQAYETLVTVNKQFDLSCVGCHVTGFRQPGGSEVVENAGLQDIQCEQCHGPGSLHVAEPERKGLPNAIRRHAEVDVCKQCHTPEHSDTFDYAAYMRDILGPVHGPEKRSSLGEGPTGRELRAAGLAAAGGGCKKM